MCGIAGLWLRRPGPLDDAERMLESALTDMEHRGPDHGACWRDDGARVLLGHRRLAIIDLSPSGHQPMTSGDGAASVVFNGEIYNYRELRRELQQAGFACRSDSDTEVLLLGYRCWGERVLDRLVGMFAFAIWDRDRQKLFLARDRAGEKPLYYANGAWGFAFASEIGSLTRVPDVDTPIDRDALSLYLQYQYVPAPHSIYRGIRKVLPGHALTVSAGGIRTWRYWDPVPFAAGPRLAISMEEAVEQLDALLRTAVGGQMIADVPLGAFLSGGVDSSAIVGAMTAISTAPVRTFTIGFDVPALDESPHAAAVARHLGAVHTAEFLTEQDAVDMIPAIPAMYGEPFADSSALPTHLVSRVARKYVTVALSGDGGDEAFGGYVRYDELERILLLSRMAGPFTSAARTLGAHLRGRLGRGAGLLGVPAKEIFRARVGVFRSADVQAMTGAVPVLSEYERAWERTAAQPVRRRAMLADLLTYLPEAILVKVDRAAMRVSLETRAPLLDHRILEFALQLPHRYTRRKRLLKSLLYRRVPRALVDRPKQGFGVPLGKWFRGELRDMLHDALTPAGMRAVGIDDYRPVRRILDSHMSGAFDEYPRLWTLLVLRLWHDTVRAHATAPEARPLAPAV
jgi:asparagine synthase (glutamine-hydrolysing)